MKYYGICFLLLLQFHYNGATTTEENTERNINDDTRPWRLVKITEKKEATKPWADFWGARREAKRENRPWRLRHDQREKEEELPWFGMRNKKSENTMPWFTNLQRSAKRNDKAFPWNMYNSYHRLFSKKNNAKKDNIPFYDFNKKSTNKNRE